LAIVPMKDTVTIVKSGGVDGWGEPIPGETITTKGRVSEKTTMVVNQNGEEIKSRYSILLPPKVIVEYGDEVSFVSSSGATITGNPESISAVKNFGGKVIFRKVNLR
jgi:hypothetical protein